jgi:uncharacterized protein (DUF488 family)
MNGLVSIGYQGRDAQQMADELTQAGVTILVDVRLTPVSRKRGFSKRALSDVLAGRDIRYIHLRALGNPRDNRQAFHAGQVAEGRRRFRLLLQRPDATAALAELGQMAKTERVAVLCFEASVEQCHRHVVLEETALLHPDLVTTYV